MGILDSFKGAFKKKEQKQHSNLPPEPPKPPFKDSSSPQELTPPPKIIDFDEEIPDLPELDIPEELGGNESPAKVSESQLKSGVVPPPQGHPGLSDADNPIGGESPELEEADEESGGIEFHKDETPKPMNTEAPVETKPSLSTIKFHENGNLFINEGSFGEVVKNLNKITETVNKSPHFKKLLEIDAQKQESISQLKTELGIVFTTLDQIDKITFK